MLAINTKNHRDTHILSHCNNFLGLVHRISADSIWHQITAHSSLPPWSLGADGKTDSTSATAKEKEVLSGDILFWEKSVFLSTPQQYWKISSCYPFLNQLKKKLGYVSLPLVLSLTLTSHQLTLTASLRMQVKNKTAQKCPRGFLSHGLT